MDVTAKAAPVFGVAAVGVIGFQVALALWAPRGAYAMGGAFPERFPPALRVAAVVHEHELGVIAAVACADTPTGRALARRMGAVAGAAGDR
jgi:hypothetical protein